MLCECINHVRISDFNNKYPLSEHAGSCDKYLLEDFAIVDDNVIMEIYEAKIESLDFDIVKLTRDQFENLKEFEGY
jgi:hypothetical protein